MAQTQADVLLFRKLRLRVMPLLILCFIAGYIDRANLGFAALAMNAKFGFSPTVYGWAAGISSSATRPSRSPAT